MENLIPSSLPRGKFYVHVFDVNWWNWRGFPTLQIMLIFMKRPTHFESTCSQPSQVTGAIYTFRSCYQSNDNKINKVTYKIVFWFFFFFFSCFSISCILNGTFCSVMMTYVWSFSIPPPSLSPSNMYIYHLCLYFLN